MDDTALTRALMRNWTAWLDLRAAIPGVELMRFPDARCLRSRLPHQPNTLYQMRFEAGSAASRLDEIVRLYAEVERGMAAYVEPGSEPEDLRKVLRARGLNCLYNMPGMAMALDRPTPEMPVAGGVRIEPVSLDIYDVYPHAHAGSGKALKAYLVNQRAMHASRPATMRHYAAWNDGRPVGVTTLLVEGDTAGIYDVAVFKDERRQGIGGALVRAAVEDGRALGCTVATLEATGAGRPVYERVGFREVCTIGVYYFSMVRQRKEAAAAAAA